MLAHQLPKPECRYGYTEQQVKEILKKFGRSEEDFNKWMDGQTITLCDGRRYMPMTGEYIEACNGVAHGGIVYTWDLERFLERKPVID